MHRPRAIDPRKAPRDPMAMRRSNAPSANQTLSTRPLTFAPRWNARGRFTSRVPTSVGTLLGPAPTATPTNAPGALPVTCPMRDERGQIVCCTPPCPTNPPPPTPTPSPSPTPTPSPTPIPTATPTPTPTPEPTPCPPGDTGIPPDCIGETPTPQPTPGLSPSTTGINHYWTYEVEPLPGIGKAMVNVGNGNLLIQVD
ncbi:MAG: hypothetical protein ACREMP_05210, partial [Candidatus Tyrphobacter sp.]